MGRHLAIAVLLLLTLPPQPCRAVQPFVEEDKLIRLEESWTGEFGNAIDSDGDTLVIGAKAWKKTENCCSCGAVFVYYR